MSREVFVCSRHFDAVVQDRQPFLVLPRSQNQVGAQVVLRETDTITRTVLARRQLCRVTHISTFEQRDGFEIVALEVLSAPPRSIAGIVADVREFHAATRQPDLVEMPTDRRPGLVRRVSRKRLLREECDELDDALVANDLVEFLDAVMDIIYILIGTGLISFGGERLIRAWDEVHASNMRKREPSTGRMVIDANGKITKPQGWVGPDIRSIVEDVDTCAPTQG